MGWNTKWKEEEDLLLRKHYKKFGVDWCKEHLQNRSRTAVMARASKLGISCGRYWNEKELDYIKENAHLPNTVIAKRLRRTPDSVRKKRYALGLGRCEDNNLDSMTISEVCRLVGIPKGNLNKTWRNHNLKAKKIGRNVLVTEADLVDFMKENTNLWDATKCEVWFFEKYEWFNEKRKHDRRKMEEQRWGKFYECS